MTKEYATKLDRFHKESCKTEKLKTDSGKVMVPTNRAKKYKLLLRGKYRPDLEFVPGECLA